MQKIPMIDNPEEFGSNIPDDNNELIITYTRVSSLTKFDKNPKRHEIGALMRSFEKNGFKDPVTWDQNLKGLVEGNGRLTALTMMERQDYDPPKGIRQNDVGDWYVLTLYGLDAESYDDAVAYAIDHNNLVMLGGDFTMWDIAKMWNHDEYLGLLSETESVFVSMDAGDIQSIFDISTNNSYDDNMELNSLTGNDSLGSDDGYSDGYNNDNYGNPTDVQFVQFKITCMNYTLADDVYDAIQNLLDENPGWDTSIYKVND